MYPVHLFVINNIASEPPQKAGSKIYAMWVYVFLHLTIVPSCTYHLRSNVDI